MKVFNLISISMLIYSLLIAYPVHPFQVASNDSAEIYIEDREEKITYYEGVEQKILISELQIQIETTQAVNDLYNFKFEKAEQQFRWLEQKYDWHPLP